MPSLWTPPGADLGELAGPEPDPRMVNVRPSVVHAPVVLAIAHLTRLAPTPAPRIGYLPHRSNPRHNARTPQAGSVLQDRRHSHRLRCRTAWVDEAVGARWGGADGRGRVKSHEVVTLLLLVTFDLDRPTRGLIRVPDTPLTHLRSSMALPPATTGPARP